MHAQRQISRMKTKSAVLLSLITLALARPCAGADEEPPGALTEQWQPVPPVVVAEPGRPPSDAIVLFDGRSLDSWESISGEPARWRIDGDSFVVVPKTPNIRTRQAFGDIQLHLEFRTPSPPSGESQHRGNSGIFFMGAYELQVLDSYRNATYVNGQAGAVYKQHPPLVNASRPPGEWQTYDAVFVAPRFTSAGKLQSPGRLTVFHNGVLVQHDVEITGPTVNRGVKPYAPHPAELPLMLQNHGDPVAFRNIWVRKLALPRVKD